MKIFFITLLLSVGALNAWAQFDEDEKKIIRYQIEISTQTADRIQAIFDRFNESFIDYEPALRELNILINEYNKAIQYISVPLPKEGKKLDWLMKQLLARVEKYLIYYKKSGRENPEIIMQIHEALSKVMFETERLSYQ